MEYNKDFSKIMNPPVEEKTVEEEVMDKMEKTTIGKVVDCTKLNIRQEPKGTAEVLCTVDVDSILMIDLDKSINTWYKVYTESGVEGYCMKQFVSLV